MLKLEGVISAIYIDDFFNAKLTYDECVLSVSKTVETFHNLGFIIHRDKSQLKLYRIIIYLGCIINSTNMTVTLRAA